MDLPYLLIGTSKPVRITDSKFGIMRRLYVDEKFEAKFKEYKEKVKNGK